MKKLTTGILLMVMAASLLFSTSLYAEENEEIRQLSWGEALNNVYSNNTSLRQQAFEVEDAKKEAFLTGLEIQNTDLEDIEREVDRLSKEKQLYIQEKTALLQKETAQDNRLDLQQSLKIQLYQAYYELIQVQEELKQQEMYKDYVQEVFNQAKIKKENGLMADLQLKEVEIQNMGAEMDYQAAERKLKDARMKLNLQMSQPLDIIYEATDEFYAQDPAKRDLDEDMAHALENRSEFQQTRHNIEANTIQMEIIELGGLFKSSPDYEDKIERLDDYEWQNKKLENQLQQQEYQVKENVKEGYNDLINLYRALEQQKNQIQTARNEWELEKQKLEAGISTESNVLEKRYSWLQKELSAIQAEANYVIAYTKYLAAINVGPAY